MKIMEYNFTQKQIQDELMPSNLTKLISEMQPLPLVEQERRRLAQQRLKERLSSIPFYAKKDNQFWRTFQGSRVLADG